MERTVPTTASGEIDLYLRTMYSLLRTTAEVQIRTLEEVHAGINSPLHANARLENPDTAAFTYSLLRLPPCMPQVRSVILGQSSELFARSGYPNIENWQPVSARARRRRCYFNRTDTLACFIASRSDIDDVVPALTAYQIEWNKLHNLLKECPDTVIDGAERGEPEAIDNLSKILRVSLGDFQRLWVVWGSLELQQNSESNGIRAARFLRRIAKQKCSLRLRLLGGSLSDYWRATRAWWDNIEHHVPELLDRPIYFVSSNTHSLANLLSGFGLLLQSRLEEFLGLPENYKLREEWHTIQSGQLDSNRENFLYYILKKYQQAESGRQAVQQQIECETNTGVIRLPSEHYFDIDAQVIDISRLQIDNLDPRLKEPRPGYPADLSILNGSNALILNIDYPLGLAAYNILSKVAEHASPILGIYIMGKAASLNGVVGDVMIPNVVHDEHSRNTYLYQNAFTAASVSPYLIYGTVLDNQKAVSVLGTFLQNAEIMDVFYREGYTDIEMEAGPYLSAIYEMSRPKRHPVNELVNLYGVPFDIGVLHYVSDTPLSKGQNLGAGTMSYYGMDSTYAASIAILRRIFHIEALRLSAN